MNFFFYSLKTENLACFMLFFIFTKTFPISTLKYLYIYRKQKSVKTVLYMYHEETNEKTKISYAYPIKEFLILARKTNFFPMCFILDMF